MADIEFLNFGYCGDRAYILVIEPVAGMHLKPERVRLSCRVLQSF